MDHRKSSTTTSGLGVMMMKTLGGSSEVDWRQNEIKDKSPFEITHLFFITAYTRLQEYLIKD
jgi:hypothetical protein